MNCDACNQPVPTPQAEAPIVCDPVLFHKVTIPASMGDETQVPATAGKYKNVLLYYAYNDHVYIYSSDGIPTYIRSGGSFNDLSNRPSYGNQTMTGSTNIPEVMDAEITITRNSSAVGSFSTNQGSDETINIAVPTKTSELTNDSNFPVDASYVHTDNNYTTADKTKLTNSVEVDTIGANLSYDSTTKTLSATAQPAVLYSTTGTNTDGAMTQKATTDELAAKATTAQLAAVQATIPTKTSDLTNDSGFVADANYVHTDNNFTSTDKGAMTNLNQNVGYDLTIAADTSTATITENKVNLYTGSTSTEVLTMPVASASQAGVMNTLTYQAIQDNSDNISAILDGAVSLSNLPASPTQAQLTTAWQTATGRTTIINGSRINDQTNSKLWTYYTNISEWTAVTNTPTVIVNDATNLAKGIVKGSATGDGTIFVESDTTMSVNGWDTLSAQVSTNTANIATKANSADLSSVATSGSYNDLTNTPTIPTATSDLTNDSNFVSDAYYVHTDNNYTNAEKTKLAGIETGAEVNDIDTIKVNGTTQTITSKAVDIPTLTATDILETTSVTPIVTTGLIVDSAVTTAKIADNNITTAKIDDEAVTADKIDWTTFSGTQLLLGDSLTNVSYPYDFEIVVIGTASIWAYGGGTSTVSISATGNPTQITSLSGQSYNGDTIARSVMCAAKYSCSANTAYGFSVSKTNLGGLKGDNIVIGIVKRIS